MLNVSNDGAMRFLGNKALWNSLKKLGMVALLLGWATSAVAAGVLEQSPENAMVVVKVRNLQETNTKAAALIDKLGLANFNPALSDPLAMIMKQFKISAGVDKAGDMAVIVLMPEADGVKPESSLLLPVSDYSAFLGNFPDAKTEGEISTFENRGQQISCAQRGHFAILSNNKNNVTGKPAGIKLAAACSKEFESKDVAAYVNMKLVAPKLLEALKKGEESIPNMAQMIGQQPGMEGQGKLMKLLLKEYVKLGRRVVEDSDGMVYSFSLVKDGLTTGAVIEFKPDSYLGKLASRLKGTEQVDFTGLPAGKYVAFAKAHVDPAVMQILLTDVLSQLKIDMEADGLKSDVLSSAAETMRAPLNSEKSVAFGVLLPAGAAGQASVFQVVQVVECDSRLVLDAQQKAMAQQAELMNSVGMKGGNFEVTPNAKKVAGVDFTQIKMAAVEGANPQEIQKMITAVYGPGGINGFMGAVDEQHLLAGWFADDDLLSAAVASVKGKTDALGKRVDVLASIKQLPSNPLAVGCVEVGNFMQLISNVSKQMGMPLQLQVQNDLPPLAVSLAAEGSALRMDGYVPMDIIQSIMVTGMMAYQQMQQHRPAPNGGGGL